MPKHITIINLACTITKLRKWGQAWKHSAESAQNAASQLTAEHERKLAEHRAAFGARTEADAKIIAGLREESAKYKAERDHFYQREGIEQKRRMDAESERDGLLTQVQDMRAEMERLRAEVAFLKIRDREYEKALDLCDKEEQTPAECIAALQERLRASIARGDFAQMEVAALKSQTPKHPVKVGEWVECVCAPGVGTKRQVLEVHADWYLVDVGHSWTFDFCIPCDPPAATHDTEAGKAAAESAVRTEPVAEEIKVGDMVEVFQKTGSCTFETDVGTRGTVLQMDDSCVDTEPLEGYRSPKGNHVALCDVRKVTT